MTGPHAPMRYDHPQFTSQELLDAWRTIRQTWKLMENHPGGAHR